MLLVSKWNEEPREQESEFERPTKNGERVQETEVLNYFITSIILQQFRMFILTYCRIIVKIDGTTTKAIRALSLVLNHETQNRNPQGL